MEKRDLRGLEQNAERRWVSVALGVGQEPRHRSREVECE